ncbi:MULTISPECIES: hypothetical protein [unclassified Moorena]|nr:MULTISPECIES: hypothetical protein [unclassified Moorena]NEQ17343.1 hypothetical protein [Moorena sp. SIO3E2]NEP66393.1 hypothetical protein [Moorena sp. SIO3A5]NEQ11276.1 hypothetical protein [Moorena sp. SIO4E2]NER87354.1 hypothetical protein [Moorena sp. SIO3A2]NET63118.1 hypothetical protein [Moorena sp. SIO1G6]
MLEKLILAITFTLVLYLSSDFGLISTDSTSSAPPASDLTEEVVSHLPSN